MNFDRLAPWFPLLLLAVLAGLAYWLNTVARSAAAPERRVQQQQPDLILQRFETVSTGDDGLPRYRLSARQMRYFESDDLAELQQPQLLRLQADGSAPLTIRADTARLEHGREQGWFVGHVQLQRPAQADKPALTVQTPRLWASAAASLARTDAPVQLQQGGLQARSVGFDYQHADRLLNLHSEVKVSYAPPPRP